jgi:MFS family permease
MTAPSADARPMGARDVLKLRDFRTLWLAQLISDAGDGLTATALLLLVNNLTGSTAAIAAMAIALAVPPLTIGLVAGTYADRWDRRRIMLASDLFRAALVLGFIVIGTAAQLPILYALAFIQASVGTFFNPAKGAILPRIVPPEGLMAANSVSQSSRVIAAVAGTAIAGGMIGFAGLYWPAFVLDAISFLLSFLLVSRLPAAVGAIPAAEHGAPLAGVRESLAIGLRVVGHSRVLWVTIVSLSLAMLGLGAVNVLFVPLLINVLHASAAWFGPLEAAQTVSMVLAAGLVGTLAARFTESRIIVVACLVVGTIIVLMGQVAAVWQLMILLFLVGWFVTPFQAAVITILQTRSEDATRGRVMSVLNASMSGTSVISMAAAGLLADRLGVPTAFLLGGLVCVSAGVLGFVLYPRRDAFDMSAVAGATHVEAARPSS